VLILVEIQQLEHLDQIKSLPMEEVEVAVVLVFRALMVDQVVVVGRFTQSTLALLEQQLHHHLLREILGVQRLVFQHITPMAQVAVEQVVQELVYFLVEVMVLAVLVGILFYHPQLMEHLDQWLASGILLEEEAVEREQFQVPQDHLLHSR
jgi:hypothetical protein